ncbi:MAG: helix-turn-helix transcriptional regulator [Bacteroidales bacterium]|nr:helix-turn-helix transcriptional regulator [Bacteroidales bacterium]
MLSNDLIKGTLRTIVLKLLSENSRMYGYEITQKVEELSKGKIKISFGALYPVLHKLEAEGHVQTESELIGKRKRIYYKLTQSGIKTSKTKLEEFLEYVEVMTYVLNPYPA